MYVKYIHRVEYRAKLFLGSALNIGPPILPPETKHQGPEWLAPSLCENNILYGRRLAIGLLLPSRGRASVGRYRTTGRRRRRRERAGREDKARGSRAGGTGRGERTNNQPTISTIGAGAAAGKRQSHTATSRRRSFWLVGGRGGCVSFEFLGARKLTFSGPSYREVCSCSFALPI
jgi:hypothetical protein